MYRIKDWALHFENAESRKIKGARWVPLPNKHDGKGFRRLARHAEAERVFSAWILILQVASKCPVRGELADENGPLTALDLADITGFREETFELAFKVLTETKIGWLEDIPWPVPEEYRQTAPQPDEAAPRPDENPKSPGASGQPPNGSGIPGNEGKGTELKGTEGNTPLKAPALPVVPHGDEVTAVIRAYPKKRERVGGGFEQVHVGDGDRTAIAAFINARPEYPLLVAVKAYAAGTTRPMNLSRFLANPTNLETVLKAQEAARKRDSPPPAPSNNEPIGPTDAERSRAADIAEKLAGRKPGRIHEPRAGETPERSIDHGVSTYQGA